MKRRKISAWKVALLVEVLIVGIIVGTTFGVLAATIRTATPEEVTAPAEQTEVPETVPTETQPETTHTAALVTLYDVPLDEELQLHILQTSEAHGIDPAVVIGVIWRESTYNAAAVGDNGNALGLMQIQPQWHQDRMDRLGCSNLLDPFQNVTVGVDILADLLDEYDGDISMALMAYNAGSTGAYRYWFSQGIYSNSYSEAVLSKAAELETH
jgi:soluble lytic murein transglycosylase-like protein